VPKQLTRSSGRRNECRYRKSQRSGTRSQSVHRKRSEQSKLALVLIATDSSKSPEEAMHLRNTVTNLAAGAVVKEIPTHAISTTDAGQASQTIGVQERKRQATALRFLGGGQRTQTLLHPMGTGQWERKAFARDSGISCNAKSRYSSPLPQESGRANGPRSEAPASPPSAPGCVVGLPMALRANRKPRESPLGLGTDPVGGVAVLPHRLRTSCVGTVPG